MCLLIELSRVSDAFVQRVFQGKYSVNMTCVSQHGFESNQENDSLNNNNNDDDDNGGDESTRADET